MNTQEFYLNPDKNHEVFLLNDNELQLPKKENQIYLDPDENHIALPRQNQNNYLQKDNYLCEFKTEEDKEKAISNLGLSSKLELLKSLIDAKVIENNSLPFDEVPTQEHTQHILSSNALYNLIQNYYTKEEIDEILNHFFNFEFKEYIDRLYYSKVLINEKLNEIYDSISSILSGVSKMQELHTTVDFNIESFDGTLTILNIHIDGNGDILREVKVQINGVTILTKSELAYGWDIPLTITEDSVVRVLIYSIYNKEKAFTKDIINDYFVPENHFYIGGGFSSEDIFRNYSPILYKIKPKGNYNIEITNDEDRIIIIIPKDARFYRADMNGIEIPFTKTYNNNYIVLTSDNHYQRGTYNIDINS